MPHIFDPKDMHKLDDPERKNIIRPLEVLQKMNLKTGDIFLDYGCGTGLFAKEAIEIIGNSGHLYAVDIFKEMLEETEKKLSGNTNVSYILLTDKRIPLEDSSVDFVFMGFVFHEISDREAVLLEIRRILKHNGKLGIIEWEKKITEKGPPVEDRISSDEAKKIISEYGFQELNSMENSINHYMVTGIKVA